MIDKRGSMSKSRGFQALKGGVTEIENFHVFGVR